MVNLLMVLEAAANSPRVMCFCAGVMLALAMICGVIYCVNKGAR